MSETRRGDWYRLVSTRSARDTSIPLTVDLADRSDSGLISGHLELVANKRDFDYGISIFELRRDGSYRQLPPYQSRASHVASVIRRRLLTPGTRVRLDFANVRLASHSCAVGSRLVVVLGINRNPRQQINYGTGGDVSGETIADDFPVWRSTRSPAVAPQRE